MLNKQALFLDAKNAPNNHSRMLKNYLKLPGGIFSATKVLLCQSAGAHHRMTCSILNLFMGA